MNAILSFLIKSYALLLRLFPPVYRQEFAEEMLLDFSDLAADAGKKGNLALMFFCLRELVDFPFNLLRIHSKEDSMTTAFRVGPAHAAFRSALALGLAFAVMMTVGDCILTVMQDQGWSFLLRIANAHGWHLDYSLIAEIILHFSALMVGALSAGILLTLCFHKTPHIKRYVLLGILGWAALLALLRITELLLKINNESLRGIILIHSWIILAGLGFGAIFSLILQDRKKTPWLLLAGILGYYIARSLSLWILIPLFPMYVPSPLTWSGLAYVASLYGITGGVIGAILGAISGWSRNRVISA